MADFRQWIRDVRGERTQAECAIRAGMKPQQWNQLEKTVKRPEPETIEAVALGLGVSVDVAFKAAGYATSESKRSELAEYVSYLEQSVRAEELPKFRRAAKQQLDALASVFPAA